MNLDQLIFALQRIRESVPGSTPIGVFSDELRFYEKLRTVVYTSWGIPEDFGDDDTMLIGFTAQAPDEAIETPTDGVALEWSDPHTFYPLPGARFSTNREMPED